MHEDLKVFLEANIGKKKKRKGVVLGVADSKLGVSIQEGLDVNCEMGGAVTEILRGIRLYFTKLVQGGCT